MLLLKEVQGIAMDFQASNTMIYVEKVLNVLFHLNVSATVLILVFAVSHPVNNPLLLSPCY